jgi:Flp pilus assembly pilin Flp
MEAVRQSLRDLRVTAGRALAGDEGQGLVEYSLILLLVAIGIVGSMASFGSVLSDRFAAIVALPWR